MVTQRSQGSQAMFDLLRQLALGLGTYRLFPSDPEQPGFVAAVGRIRETATTALALSARHAEVRSGRFRDDTGEELSDEHVDRLAAACYERGVEFVTVRDVPRVDELRSVFRVLSLTESEVAEAGGVAALLEASGVVALRLGDVAPRGGATIDPALEGLSAEQLDVWRDVMDPRRFAANLLVSGLPEDAATAAQDVYRRFETVRAVLPVPLTTDPQFVQNLIRIVEALPGSVRREFGTHSITRAREGDELASDYLGSMTDPELAGMLVDLEQDGGPHARAVAASLVERVGRQPDIVEITTAYLEARGLAEPAAGAASTTMVNALTASESDAAVDDVAREAAADLFASRLLAETDRDITELRAAYPDDPSALRRAALDAFRDYLLNEEATDRLGQALEIWALHLRDAIAQEDDAAVGDLFEVIEGAHEELAETEQRRLVKLARSRILDAELLRALAERAKHDTQAPAVVATLRRFGSVAEDALLDLLADEENRGTRAVLVTMVAELARDVGLDALLARLGDERWYVVRNCVTILGRVPDRAGFPHLAGLVGHPDPHVRRELVRAMVASAGSDAVPYLERLARDRDEGVQSTAITALGSLVSGAAAQALGRVVDASGVPGPTRRALDQLRTHASEEATAVLTDLARRGHRPKLPRKLRKHARACLSARGRQR